MSKYRRIIRNEKFKGSLNTAPKRTAILTANRIRMRGYNARVIPGSGGWRVYVGNKKYKPQKTPRKVQYRPIKVKKYAKKFPETNDEIEEMIEKHEEIMDEMFESGDPSDLEKLLESWSVDSSINALGEKVPYGMKSFISPSLRTATKQVGEESPVSIYDVNDPNWSRELLDDRAIDEIEDFMGFSRDEIMEMDDDELKSAITYTFSEDGMTEDDMMQIISATSSGYEPDAWNLFTANKILRPDYGDYLSIDEFEKLLEKSLSERQKMREDFEDIYQDTGSNRFDDLKKYVNRAKNKIESEVVMIPVRTWKVNNEQIPHKGMYEPFGNEIIAMVTHPSFIDVIRADMFKAKDGEPVNFPTEANFASKIGSYGIQNTDMFYEYMEDSLLRAGERIDMEERFEEHYDDFIYESTDLAFINAKWDDPDFGEIIGVFTLPHDGEPLDYLPEPAAKAFPNELWPTGGITSIQFRGQEVFEAPRTGKGLFKQFYADTTTKGEDFDEDDYEQFELDMMYGEGENSPRAINFAIDYNGLVEWMNNNDFEIATMTRKEVQDYIKNGDPHGDRFDGLMDNEKFIDRAELSDSEWAKKYNESWLSVEKGGRVISQSF